MKAKFADGLGEANARPGDRAKLSTGMRWACAGLVCVAFATGVVWLAQRSGRPEQLTYNSDVSPAEAEALVARMLATNRCWITPEPVRASYSFRRNVTTWSLSRAWNQRSLRELRTSEREVAGPFIARWKSVPSLRVGVTAETPLYAMLQDRGGYAIRPVGKATWRGRTVVAVDVTFQNPPGGRVGMGAGRVGYSSAGFSARCARILIDPLNAVPLFLATLESGFFSVNRPRDSTFTFGPQFLQMPGGCAPRFIEWQRPDLSWRSRYEFQVTQGHWFFKRGKASIWTDRWSNLNQQLETVGLQMQPLRPGDLLQEYPTQLTAADPAPERARPWRFGPEDIFLLSRFSLAVGQELRLELGQSDLGVGYCEDGALWAVLIPRGDGNLNTRGTGRERPVHVWLRFHPAEIGRLFPPDRLSTYGAEDLRAKLCAIANLKMLSSWSADGLATIPGPGQMIVDVDTTAGLRRFFTVDTQTETARYSAEFERRAANLSPKAIEVMSEPLPDHRKALGEQSRDKSRPKVISVWPAPGAQGVPLVTELRIRFDRPMDPLALTLDWESGDFESAEFPRYNADNFEFTVPVRLVAGVLHQLVINKEERSFGVGFISADAKPASLYVWRFTTESAPVSAGPPVAAGPPMTEGSGSATAANGSGELLNLLQRMQQQRAALTSLVERVQTISQFHGRGFRALTSQGAVFKWQFPGQFYGDVSQIMSGLFRVGCDGQNWWWETGSISKPDQVVCPTNGMQLLNISLADPFGLTEDSPAVAARNLGLAYAGMTNCAGRECYVLEARPGPPSSPPTSRWWIDVRSLLVLDQETGGSHARFLYDSVNRQLPLTAFAPMKGPGVKSKGPEPLDAVYTQRFVNVCDGANGRMSVRWGKVGPKARASSGLN